MRHGMNQDKVRRYGKNFGTIDFEINQNLTTDQISRKTAETVIGDFHIGGKVFQVSLAEIDRIIETATSAKSVFSKSYAMGRHR
tara:strand:- start:32 stop:283 length:252 start_codon:yes stop_codon:yes gene_type:complete